MTTEVAEPEPSPADDLNFNNRQIKYYSKNDPPKHIGYINESCRPIDVNAPEESARFCGGIYGLGTVALLTMASHSREPYRAARNVLRSSQGVSGFVRFLSNSLACNPGQENDHRIDEACKFISNLKSILENFSNPEVIDTAREIAAESPADSYCSLADIDAVTYGAPALVFALETKEHRQDRKDLIKRLKKGKRAQKTQDQDEILLDIAGVITPPERPVHSIPLARVVLPRVLDRNFSPYTLDSASLLLGVAAQHAWGIPSISVLEDQDQ
jgi:hypothetical protein